MRKNAASRRMPELTPETQKKAMYIAKVVRDALEDFHVDHIPDEHMKELNMTIRDAICTALYADEHYDDSPGARIFVDEESRTVPYYWEQPKLTEDFDELTIIAERLYNRRIARQ